VPLLQPRAHSLRTYLFLGLGSVAIAFVVVTVGLRAFVEGRASAQAEVQVRSISRYRAQQALLLVLMEEEIGLRSFLATGDQAFLSTYDRGRRAEEDAVRTILDNLPEQEADSARDHLARMVYLINEWHEKAGAPLIMARFKGPLPNLSASMAEEKTRFDAVKEAGTVLQRQLDTQDERHLASLDEALLVARWSSALTYLALLLAGISMARWLLRKVADPIQELAGQAWNGDGFTEPLVRQPVKEVDILGRALYELDTQSREREQVLRRAHEEALAASAFTELVQHISREEDLVAALDQCLTRQLGTTDQHILLRNPGGEGLVSASRPMTAEEAASHPILAEPNLCRAIHKGASVDLPSSAPTACICPLGVPAAGSYLCIPLLASGKTLGLVNLQSRNPAHFTTGRRRLAETLTAASASAMRALRTLDNARERSIRDALTGAHNRRFLDEFLPKIADQAKRKDFPLSLLMLDIDHFKLLNDEFGHEAGDQALRAFAQCLITHVRGGDVVTRYGGEEFAILLPHTGPDLARDLAERLRRALQEMPLPEPPFPHGRGLTTSIGVASYPTHTPLPDTLMSLADRALYQAKAEGRNRVVGAGALVPVPDPAAP